MAILTQAYSGQHFDPTRFDALLGRHGTPATWYRRSACPCLGQLTTPTTVVREGDAGQPDPNCPICHDLVPGSVYDAGQCLTILGPGRVERDQYVDAGRVLAGAVTLTFPSAYTPGHLDYVTLQVGRMVVNNEYHIRGQLNPDGRSLERLVLPEVLEVESAVAIVDGARADYLFFTDFTVDGDGAITWNDSSGPPNGAQYSVRYQTRPQYILWEPQSRDEGGIAQPYKCIAQRLDAFYHMPVGEGD